MNDAPNRIPRSRQHAGVDRLDAGVRMRTAQHCGMHHRGQMNVVDVSAVPRQQPRVLDPLHRAADPAIGRARRRQHPHKPDLRCIFFLQIPIDSADLVIRCATDTRSCAGRGS